jgi:hypothetical protein
MAVLNVLSRCNRYVLTIEDAEVSFALKTKEMEHMREHRILSSVSQNLQGILMEENRRHRAYCRYWCARSQYDLGQIDQAERCEC